MRPDPSDLSIALTIPWDLKLVAFLSFLASPFEAVGHSPPNTQTCSPVEGKVISVRALVPGGKVQLPCRLAEATSFSGHLVAHSKSLATAHDSLLAVRWLKTSTSHSLSCVLDVEELWWPVHRTRPASVLASAKRVGHSGVVLCDQARGRDSTAELWWQLLVDQPSRAPPFRSGTVSVFMPMLTSQQKRQLPERLVRTQDATGCLCCRASFCLGPETGQLAQISSCRGHPLECGSVLRRLQH